MGPERGSEKLRQSSAELGLFRRTRGSQLAKPGRANKYRTCDMNMEEEGKVYMSALWSKLAQGSFLKAENESAGSGVQPAAATAKCVMR